MDDIINSGRPIVISSLTMGILATIATSLRFLAKLETEAGLAADDYWITISLATYWAYTGVALWSVFQGGGGLDMRNIAGGSSEGIILLLKSLIINSCLFVTSKTAVKISIIFYYRRIFSVQILLKRCTAAVGVITICLWITSLFGITMSSVPLKNLWNTFVPVLSMNVGIFFLSVTIIDLLLDVSLLCLPLWVISHLQLPCRQLLSLALIFLLGGFVCITSILRIVYTYVPGSRTIALDRGAVWTTIHLGTCIICASLPTLRPLMIKWMRSLTTLRERYNLSLHPKSQSSESGWKIMIKDTNLVNTSGPEHSGDRIHLAEALDGANELEAREGHPPDSIVVKTTISVV